MSLTQAQGSYVSMLLTMSVTARVGISKPLNFGTFVLHGDVTTPYDRKVFSEYENFPFVGVGGQAYP